MPPRRRSSTQPPREITGNPDAIALPLEGTTPKASARRAPPPPAPVHPGEAVVNAKVYASVRGLKDHSGSFIAECNRAGLVGRKPISEWDRIYNDYMHRPVRG